MNAEIVVKLLNVIQAAFSFLQNHGLTKDRIQTILDAAAGGDVDTATVQAELDALANDLNDTQGMIDNATP